MILIKVSVCLKTGQEFFRKYLNLVTFATVKLHLAVAVGTPLASPAIDNLSTSRTGM